MLGAYVIVNALVRDASGTGLVVVLQAAPGELVPHWAVPGGKVERGRDRAQRTVHYLVPDDARAHAIVHVFDGQGEGVAAVLSAGAVPSPDPEGDVQLAEMVRLATAIERLGAMPERLVREPLLAYLAGDRPAGCFWSYPVPGTGQEPSVFEPRRR